MITPILKSGKPSSDPQSSSGRPVALLSSLSKLLEKFVHKQFVTHCFSNSIIPDDQFGFPRGRLAEWQLLQCMDDWHTALDANHRVHAVFLDASKAFDRVHHGTLLSIIANAGAKQSALGWFQSYLTGRTICTRVLDALSPAGTVTSGVPQGSVLGPLLFLLYFKDIPASTDAQSPLFADDTMLYRKDCSGGKDTPCCSLQSDLIALSRWADDHHFNSALQSVAASQPNCPLVQDLEQQSNSPRYALRILIYRACSIIPTLVLLWPPIRSVGTTTSIVWTERLLATFTCAELLLSATTCMEWPFVASLLHLFVRAWSTVVQCGVVHWSPALLKNVEKVQLRVARVIVRNTTLQDVSTLQQARLPTLSWRRWEHCLGLLWQLSIDSIGKGPPALQASRVPCAQLRSTCFPHSFRFPSASSSCHLSSFLCQTVPIWNRLPSSVISSTSLSSFRSAVRHHFVSDMFTYGLS